MPPPRCYSIEGKKTIIVNGKTLYPIALECFIKTPESYEQFDLFVVSPSVYNIV